MAKQYLVTVQEKAGCFSTFIGFIVLIVIIAVCVKAC
jgi:hypothetical protein